MSTGAAYAIAINEPGRYQEDVSLKRNGIEGTDILYWYTCVFKGGATVEDYGCLGTHLL